MQDFNHKHKLLLYNYLKHPLLDQHKPKLPFLIKYVPNKVRRDIPIIAENIIIFLFPNTSFFYCMLSQT